MFSFFRFFLFLIPAETAHNFTMRLLKFLFFFPVINRLFFHPPRAGQSVTKAGIFFPNQTGLAAGFDKDGKYIDVLAGLGFGFIEVGTVTPKPQKGNPKPRLFRLTKDEALINRMGFNNEGVEQLVERLKNRNSLVPVGGNIGKNKNTPNEEAEKDYLFCFDKLYPYVDYFVVNVSSPNTPGLRELQQKDKLTSILNTLTNRRATLQINTPILLKIAPDLTNEQLDEIIEITEKSAVDGIIATNTTISRENLSYDSKKGQEIQGGLSGSPLRNRSMEVLKYIRAKVPSSFLVISSGGIMDEVEAQNRFTAGADLIQLYSGFVYSGPKLIREITNNNQAPIFKQLPNE